jgi:hypothetical protein
MYVFETSPDSVPRLDNYLQFKDFMYDDCIAIIF